MAFAFFCVAVVVGYGVQELDGNIFAQTDGSTQSKRIDNCVACHQKNKDETVGLHANSTHWRRGISCKECHGGDGSASDKRAAHSQNFTGRMTPGQILERCGTCHKTQLSTFQASRHFGQGKTTVRVDCVQCHGAHTIGKFVGDSNFTYVCAGCHGLEYLPDIPSPLQKSLVITDETRDVWRDLVAKGIKPSEESLRLRRELRRSLGQWVHATDGKGAQYNAAKFFEMTDKLKKLLVESAGK